MNDFYFSETNLKDAYLIQCVHSGDNRGRFTKLFEKEKFEKSGLKFELSESFLSVSSQNVIRGMHFQLYHPQTKMVSVLRGKAFDVIVDLRKFSETYKQWQGFELSSKNNFALYVPKGFAHGFLAMEDNTVMMYQCEGKYDRSTDTGIRFDDPDINIAWPIQDDKDIICSERDLELMTFKDFSAKTFIF